ncbi:hypothetical protein [Amycolatopsis sp. NPDC052450]|uniref:hypothetical protein n=1 Tax=Amycolatopsis sp. NPDC052450 TaxID=3363937 RepID=UPI0037C710CB
MTSPFLWPGLPAAVLAALALGISKALQHHATQTAPLGGLGTVAAARAVAGHPLWLGSVVANAAGIGLQWLALSSAPLAVVQPVLVLGLVFAVLVSGQIARRKPDRVVLAGTLLCAAGLAPF